MNQKLTNRLVELFSFERGQLLGVYTMAGYPERDSLTEIIPALQSQAVDFIEVGIPYSDPIADGPVIQSAGEIALQNGMSLELLFEQLADIQTKVPLVLMGYFNTVLQFGIERFLSECGRCGIDGVILPDLPVDLFALRYSEAFRKAGICYVPLATSRTTPATIQLMDQFGEGFLYTVSGESTTGNDKRTDQFATGMKRLKDAPCSKSQLPGMIGFNINSKEKFDQASEVSRGGIIGSAFIKALDNSADMERTVEQFVRRIRVGG